MNTAKTPFIHRHPYITLQIAAAVLFLLVLIQPKPVPPVCDAEDYPSVTPCTIPFEGGETPFIIERMPPQD